MRFCINSTRWDFEPTLIWIQMYGTSPGDQMIISHQWRDIIQSDAWCKAHLFSINRPRNTQFHEGTDDLISDSSEMITLIWCFSVSLISNSLSFSCTCLSEQQVSLHTDFWQHHNPELHIQEEPSYVTFEFSNHHGRLPHRVVR